MTNINPSPIQLNGGNLPTTEEFTCLGSIVRHDGGAGKDIRKRLNKARNAFRMLDNKVEISTVQHQDKLRLYQNCVVSTLLYGLKCWRLTVSDLTKLSELRYLLSVIKRAWKPFSSEKAMEMDRAPVQKRTRQHHTRCSPPEGKRKRGRPQNTW